jgi:hypothetical protein
LNGSEPRRDEVLRRRRFDPHQLAPSGTVAILAALVLVAVVSGMALWMKASDGTKQADMGAAIVSTGLFGFLLLLVEQGLARQTADVGRRVNLGARPTPAKDVEEGVLDQRVPASRADEPMAGEPDAQPNVERTPDSGTDVSTSAKSRQNSPGRFTAVVDKWMRDSSRIDADQLRIRVLHDDKYFQFFTAIVPGTEFRVGVHGIEAAGVTFPQFQRAIGELAVEQIKQAVADGTAPRDGDQTVALELFPDVQTAVRIARGLEDKELVNGEVIGSWIG